MIAGIRGRLITASYADVVLAAPAPGDTPPKDVVRALDDWSARREAEFGPSSSVRGITDGIAIPLLRILGFTVTRRVDGNGCSRLEAGWQRTRLVPVAVFGWNHPLDAAWRDSVLAAVRADERWSLVLNGTALRIVDAHRTWSRHYLEFDLALIAADPQVFALLWRVGRAESFAVSPRALDVAADESARHGTAICNGLANGVLEALDVLLHALARGQRRAGPELLLEQSLTVLYRVLFL